MIVNQGWGLWVFSVWAMTLSLATRSILAMISIALIEFQSHTLWLTTKLSGDVGFETGLALHPREYRSTWGGSREGNIALIIIITTSTSINITTTTTMEDHLATPTSISLAIDMTPLSHSHCPCHHNLYLNCHHHWHHYRCRWPCLVSRPVRWPSKTWWCLLTQKRNNYSGGLMLSSLIDVIIIDDDIMVIFCDCDFHMRSRMMITMIVYHHHWWWWGQYLQGSNSPVWSDPLCICSLWQTSCFLLQVNHNCNSEHPDSYCSSLMFENSSLHRSMPSSFWSVSTIPSSHLMSLPSLINDGWKLLKIFRTFALAVGCDPSASASQLVQCLQVFNLIISSILSHCYLIPQKVPLEQLISHVRLFDHEDKVFLVAQLSTTIW